LAKTDYTNTSADGFLAKTVKKTEGGETVETLEELTLTLTTVSQPTYLKVAEAIAEQAKTVGIKIQIEAVEPVAFYDQVVKPRAYQMLLTATQFGLDSDPYSFWHSSQSKDPGLNLSLYTNKKVDELLEKGRSDNNPETRSETYRQFQSLLSEDLPAIFLYQPNYAYAVSDKIKNISLTEIKTPSDRFQHLTDWYIKTKNVLR
jgi:peptide/nickel transport system substrate-binding protein